MKKGIIIFLLSCLIQFSVFCQNNWIHGQLKVSANGHFLQYEDGTPFFWLGDTAWELFHRLKLEEIETYLDNRQSKGFNVIQAVVLSELDGLTKPNQYGELPLHNLDPTKPNEKYFQLVDSAVKMAEARNMFIGLLPTWGDKVTLMWGPGPVIFNEENAFTYGLWIANRYKNAPNIIWILGGDRPPVDEGIDYTPIWRAMAKGILEATDNKAFITYHPKGVELSSSQFIHNEKWLDMNMIQSGHFLGHDVPIWDLVYRDLKLIPSKPVLDAEPNYEDHPYKPWPTWDPASGYYLDYDVRKQTYRSVFAGACGVTYGHHSVWQFYSPREEGVNHADRYWTDALDRPGAVQVGYLKKLIESRPMLTRIPDQSIIIKGQGEGGEYICATRDSLGSYLMVYIPFGKTISINTQSIKSKKEYIWWFNPRNAEIVTIGLVANKGMVELTPPTLGPESDWVLVIDNKDYKYAIPNFND